MASKVTLYGDYSETPSHSEFQSLHLKALQLGPDELWENGTLSASYISKFWESFFPEEPKDHKADIRDSIRYVTAELIGNAVKYSAEPDFIVEVALDPNIQEFRVILTNSLNPNEATGYRNFVEQLLNNDPVALYVDQMEKNAVGGHWRSSIGILTIMLDYGGYLAWKFETDEHSDKQTATTVVRMPIPTTHLG